MVLRLLVVDDDVAVRTVMRTALEADATRSVICAAGAEEAMAAIAKERPDAALVDACLPTVSGLDLANRLVLADIPVLLVSGHPDYQSQMAANGCRFLPKPFRLEALYTEVRILLDDATEHNRLLAEGLERLACSRRSLADARREKSRLVADSQAARKQRNWAP
jgi:DNA-binding NtrC family response regulator